MKANNIILTSLLLLLGVCTMQAQDAERVPHASQWLSAPTAGLTPVQYRYDAPGIEYRVAWGMDVAWNWDVNVRRGTYHIGKENISYGRISFQPNDLVGEDLQLSARQKKELRSRVTNILISGTTDVLLNCDHEMLVADHYKQDTDGDGVVDTWISGGEADWQKSMENYHGENMALNWYRLIKASLIYAETLGVKVIAIAPFNEPDFTGWNEGSMQDFRDIAQLLSEDSDLAGVRICAGNTLNDDRALEWYNFMKPYVQEGNTHQLAGSFANYANFFQTVRADGNIATADELHNTMEAFVAVEYGLQNGIWWGFDGITRGRYCKATSGGQRLGYGESRDTWTAGCVYRLPDGSVDAFLGSSERQANTNTFVLNSLDRDVFYDGYGPVRSYTMQIPGGTGYSKGQTNAERTIHITSGADVPLCPIADGEYVIMNKQTRRCMSTSNNASNGATVSQQQRHSTRADEVWRVEAVDPRVGGDFSYHYITNTQGDRLLDVQNSNLTEGGGIIAYAGGKGNIEQWHFIYAGGGDYYIQSRYSGLFLVGSSSTGPVVQRSLNTGNPNFRWRLIPTDAQLETTSPLNPTELKATPRVASVLLEWEASTSRDIDSYIVLRGEATTAEGENWQTVGRQITGTQFLDNSLEEGKAYLYKVQSVDVTGNRSEGCEAVAAQTLATHGLVARYTFDKTLNDSTDNQMDAACDIVPTYNIAASTHKQGTASLTLNTSATQTHYLSLPHEVGNLSEMTVALWLRWRGGSNWQRIFDFGNGTDQYIFLTPQNGSNKLSLVLKNGGDEQILNSTAPLTKNTWQHVAVTLSETTVKIYVNGDEVASTEDITLRPSDFKPSLCYIGRSQFSNDPYLFGYLDDLCIYNYALTPDEVHAVMEGLATGVAPAMLIPSTSPVVATEYYSLGGMRLARPVHGICIEKQHRADGSVTTRKVVR